MRGTLYLIDNSSNSEKRESKRKRKMQLEAMQIPQTDFRI